MNAGDLIKRVRNIAGDVDALQFTNSQLVDWINDGIRECAQVNNLLQKRGSQATVPGQSDYSIPDDILKLHSIKYNDIKLSLLTLEEFDEQYVGVGASTTSSPATPSVCYVWAGSLTLFPAPSEAKQLVIDYLYAPAELTEDNLDVEIPLPVGYHIRIVDYCLAQIAQQDDDMNRYTAKMQEFKSGVQDLKDQPEYSYDLYPTISVDARDMGNGFEYDY